MPDPAVTGILAQAIVGRHGLELGGGGKLDANDYFQTACYAIKYGLSSGRRLRT